MELKRQEPQSADSMNLQKFGLCLLVLEVVIIILFGIFVRMETHHASDELASQRYAAFQDINVMMLIGFGFLMTFIRTHSWSALAYTFFINAIIVQIYILFKAFWQRVFHGFEATGTYIKLEQILLTESSYAVASVLIAFGGIIGRVGPRQLLMMGIIQIIGYALNEIVVLEKIGSFDAGGSMTIHSYGAYFGLTISLILSSKIKPVSKPEANYTSNIFAMVGTLFLWLFWPSFNYGVFSETSYEQSQIVANTLLSLTGSCLSTFIFSSLLGHGIDMEDILNATLAGGVAIGSACGILYYPGVALAIGFMAGVISIFGFKYLSSKLLHQLGLYDSCGIHNLHGLPGVFGGVMSAIIIAFYNTGYDADVAANYGPNGLFNAVKGSFLNQGGLQIAGTFTSVGMGIIFGVIGGVIINTFYNEKPSEFFKDSEFFEHTGQVTSNVSNQKDQGLGSAINLQSHDIMANENPE